MESVSFDDKLLDLRERTVFPLSPSPNALSSMLAIQLIVICQSHPSLSFPSFSDCVFACGNVYLEEASLVGVSSILGKALRATRKKLFVEIKSLDHSY